MYRLWFPLNSNKVGFIRSCHFQGQSKVLLCKSSSRSSFVHVCVKNSCFRWHSLKRVSRKQHTSGTCTHFTMTRKCDFMSLCVLLFRLNHADKMSRHDHIFKLLFPFLWSTLALLFRDLIACNEFLIQAHIDLHMLTQNGQWGICWKPLITSGAWQQLFPPPFIWRSVTVQMGVIFQLYRVLSPQQASNIESAFKKKKKEKCLWIQSQSFFSGLKYAMWTQEVFYQTSNW